MNQQKLLKTWYGIKLQGKSFNCKKLDREQGEQETQI